MSLIVKFLLFAGSFLGYSIWGTKQWNIRCEFMPILYCALVSNLMFIAGILNFMPEMVFLVFAGGYIALLFSLKYYTLDKRELLLYIILGILILYFSWLLRGAQFTRYDNFSHWAVVVKSILLKNRMPNFEDTLIVFQAYPLGSSLFLYYAAKILGTSDACLIWGQVFIMLGAIFSMVVFIGKKRWYLSIIILIFGAYSFVMNVGIYDLLVDTLLPLVGIAAFGIIHYYRNTPRKAIAYSSCVFMFLVNVKNSGIFFYIICIFYLLGCIRKDMKIYWKRFILESIVPVVTIIFLWKRHIGLVFRSAAVSKHSMSLSNYKHVFQGKTIDDILSICQKMKETFFSFNDRGMQCLLIITIFSLFVGIICYWGKERYFWKGVRRITLGVWIIMLAYQLSLLLMYLFSMPLGEALSLASYTRYERTVILFILGIFLIVVLDEWRKLEITNSLHTAALYGALIFGVLGISWAEKSISFSSLYIKQNFENSQRYQLQQIIEQYDIPTGKRYMICKEKTDSGYLYYLGRYEFWTTEVQSVLIDELSDKDSLKEKYDYLIIWESTPEMIAKLQKLGYECPDQKNFAISLSDAK